MYKLDQGSEDSSNGSGSGGDGGSGSGSGSGSTFFTNVIGSDILDNAIEKLMNNADVTTEQVADRLAELYYDWLGE